MVVIDQVLVVCVGMDSLNVTMRDAETVVDDLQHWRNRIGRA